MLQHHDQVTGEFVSLDGEEYYRIANAHRMPDFFMSLVGPSDHWMFISSTGALTAGRCDPDSALFPYGSDDQISVAQSKTGSTTLLRFANGNELWEPFTTDTTSNNVIRRNLYKNPLGNKLVFEELNETRNLTFRYRWTFSEKFGFVRTCRLENNGDKTVSFELMDGLRNLLPYGVGSDFMMRFSNLANAYKKSELLDGSGLGLFYLSSIPTDRAEPSEGLMATTVWQSGLKPQAALLSTQQLDAFRAGEDVHTEVDVRGQAGAFLLCQTVELAAGQAIEWNVVAELAQDHVDVVRTDAWLQSDIDHTAEVATDVEASEQDFLRIVSSSDALQCGSNARRSNRHLSNTVFNVMRGGIPLRDYLFDSDDFIQHVAGFNLQAFERNEDLLRALPCELTAADLQSHIADSADSDLRRLALEYLPLAFSRRHGDPTRPWNRFAIHLRSQSGRTNLNYQGNWRDIFQNWEALAFSFPDFSTAMICRFVNATTADGYNPYRVTKDGFEWEEPTPNDPWANIGYWGDHQIIYLLKLLEWNRRIDAGGLESLLNEQCFVHANIPYRIKDFADIKQDPQSTIDFDADLSKRISERVETTGTDGKLLVNQSGEIHRVSLLEKLLTLTLAKLSNLVPDGGIWLNTQRPEWNDANNALVGNGLSMVTVCYLHRWCRFLQDWLASLETDTFSVSSEVAELLQQFMAVLSEHSPNLDQALEPTSRAAIVTALSEGGAAYRNQLYNNGPSGASVEVARAELESFFDTARQHLEATIRNNRRSDGLYHAYNLLDWRDDGVHVEYLYEMLEGQVAALSSGLLDPAECVELLDALRSSALYRENQDSYLLYPDRQLPRFLDKNLVSDTSVEASPLLQRLLADGNGSIVQRDCRGGVHFHGSFKNAADMRSGLKELPEQYAAAAESERDALSRLFEETFNHRQFTGRSGTFFAYEGLGSIYWHMVSKLGLAVSENFFAAIDSGSDPLVIEKLRTHFQAIRRGIGAEKSPLEYGAFPSDPYSHTPENAGVKQPGMTGQVKEDVLSRFAEVGAHVIDGVLTFRLNLFDRDELLKSLQEFTYYGLSGEVEAITVPAQGFAFTLCQVPITYVPGNEDTIQVRCSDGKVESFAGTALDRSTSKQLFSRSGEIVSIECHFRDLKPAT